MTDGEVLEWVEQHVATILMVPSERDDGNIFLVTWIDDDGYHRSGDSCKSLRELAERHS